MTLTYDNLRIRELAVIADINKPFFEDFMNYLMDRGFDSVYDFISDQSESGGFETILRYLNRDLPPSAILYDGIARPYPPRKAKWLFLGWLFRDAPEQRLRPMVSSMPGESPNERRAALLDIVRKGLVSSFDGDAYWQWEVIREVMIDRLEGSRRAIKGTLFESIVRRILVNLFDHEGMSIEVPRKETRLEGETYDVSLIGAKGTILMPVKTRETMGGGHALLFTRDIHKSISAARDAGFECIPVVIAESWTGDLQSLGCEKTVYLNMNPNRIKSVEESLEVELKNCIEYIRRVCLD